MINLTRIIFIFFLLNSISVTQSQSLEDEDSNDFGTPNQTTQTNEEDDCALSKDSELINLLNFKLKKFNPTGKEFESGPPLTEERRKEFCKLASKYAEEGKVALRNIRRDAVDKEKKDEKDGLISIDESRDNQSEIQKITDKYIALIENKLSEKEKEILKV